MPVSGSVIIRGGENRQGLNTDGPLHHDVLRGRVAQVSYVGSPTRRSSKPGTAGREEQAIEGGWRGWRSRGGGRGGVAARQGGRRGPRWTMRWWRQREVRTQYCTARRFDLPWRAAVVALGGHSHSAPSALPRTLSPRNLMEQKVISQGATTPIDSDSNIQRAQTPTHLHVEDSGARTPSATPASPLGAKSPAVMLASSQGPLTPASPHVANSGADTPALVITEPMQGGNSPSSISVSSQGAQTPGIANSASQGEPTPSISSIAQEGGQPIQEEPTESEGMGSPGAGGNA